MLLFAARAVIAAQPSAVVSLCPYCGRPVIGKVVPFAVMIDDHRNARPQSGLNQACLVVEAPVEGGITRFMALYGHGQTVPKIGPVRSMRPYFVSIARSLGAVLVHCGGSPAAYDLAPSLGLPRLDDIRGGYRAFWRDKNRSSPHNLFTSSALVQAEIRRRGITLPSIDAAPFASSPVCADLPASPLTITCASCVFTAGSQGYIRKINGIDQRDEAGQAIMAVNVALFGVSCTVLDRTGRLGIALDELRAGLVYGPCSVQEAFWSSERAARVLDGTGHPLPLSPGLFWLALVPSAPKAAPAYDATPVRFELWAD